MSHRKYTYEEVKEIAEKYDTLVEFTKIMLVHTKQLFIMVG